MTLILKANMKIRLNKLTDVISSGVTSYLDFRDKTYMLNGIQQHDYTSILDIVRASRAGEYDVVGAWGEVLDQIGRISVDQAKNDKGFLIEGAFVNLLLNSKSPASQSISINPSVLSGAYVLSVAGSGSAKLTVDNQVIGTATQFNPVVYKPTQTGAKSANVSVNGALEYIGLYNTVQAVEKISRVTTIGAQVSFNADVVRFKKDLLAQLFSGFEGCVVIKQFMPKDIFDRKINVVQSGTIAQFLTAGTNGIFVARQENGANANHLRVKTDTNEQFAIANDELSKVNIFALNFSKSSAKLAVNGKISSELSFSPLDLVDLLIGGGTQWSTTIQQYIQEIATFNRKLTDVELINITK